MRWLPILALLLALPALGADLFTGQSYALLWDHAAGPVASYQVTSHADAEALEGVSVGGTPRSQEARQRWSFAPDESWVGTTWLRVHAVSEAGDPGPPSTPIEITTRVPTVGAPGVPSVRLVVEIEVP